MASTVQQIIDAAVDRSLLNDDQVTELTSDTGPIIAYLDRIVNQVYVAAARPPDAGENAKRDYFATSDTVVLVAGSKALPTAPAPAWTPLFLTAAGARINVASRRGIVDGVAELPPAVIVQQNTVYTAGRTGDPGDTDTLTVIYTPVPGPLALTTDYIGATTPATASTSVWPSHVGDEYLISALAEYLGVKAGDRDPTELKTLADDKNRALALLMALVR